MDEAYFHQRTKRFTFDFLDVPVNMCDISKSRHTGGQGAGFRVASAPEKTEQ